MSAKTKWLARNIAAPGPYMALVTSEDQYLQALKHCNLSPIDTWISTPQADATTHFLEDANKDVVAIVAIRVPPERTGIAIAGLLVHEAVHIVQHYFAHIGEHNPAAEQEAYAVQNVAQELMRAYSELLK